MEISLQVTQLSKTNNAQKGSPIQVQLKAWVTNAPNQPQPQQQILTILAPEEIGEKMHIDQIFTAKLDHHDHERSTSAA